MIYKLEIDIVLYIVYYILQYYNIIEKNPCDNNLEDFKFISKIL